MAAQVEHHAAGQILQPLTNLRLMPAAHLCVHTDDLAQGAVFCLFQQVDDVGVVAVHVAGVEGLAAFLGSCDHFLEGIQLSAAGFFHMDMLTGLEGHGGILGQVNFVGFNSNSLDGGIVQDLLQSHFRQLGMLFYLCRQALLLVFGEADTHHLEILQPQQALQDLHRVAVLIQANLGNTDFLHYKFLQSNCTRGKVLSVTRRW